MIKLEEVKWDGYTLAPEGRGYMKASADSTCPECKCSVYMEGSPWGCLCRCHDGWKAMHNPGKLREEKEVRG